MLVNLSVCMVIFMFVCLSVCLCVCVSVAFLFLYVPVCLFLSLSLYLSLSVCFSQSGVLCSDLFMPVAFLFLKRISQMKPHYHQTAGSWRAAVPADAPASPASPAGTGTAPRPADA